MQDFNLIPVIDLKGGSVVHAREGRRSEYRPVQSRLCRGADPVTVVEAFAQRFPFRILYVADLDAISGQGNHVPHLRDLAGRFPDLELWVDAGISEAATLAQWVAGGIGSVVLGSESLQDAAFVADARRVCEPILSLDFTGDRFQGPPELLSHPDRFWPGRVLAMNVRRVGSGAGPDLALVLALARKNPGGCVVYAAGGVRSAADLRDLRDAGAAGALVATALHEETIGQRDFESFSREAMPRKKGKPAP